MSPAPAATRALRVGVVLSDTVIAEHVIRSGTAFTIGQSIRNLVPLPISGLPRRWQLLELVEGGVLLRLAPGMGAKISTGGQVLERADLDRLGAATRTATLITIPIGAHGKLALGEVRVLFQELALPLPAPALPLPRALRGSLADRIDRRMAAFAAASLLAHVGIMTAASLNDPPGDPSAAERALAQYTPETLTIIDASDPILDLTTPTPAPTPDPAPTPGTTATPTTRPTPEPDTSPATTPRPRPPGPVASDPAHLAEDATRLADALFADDGRGPTRAGMDSRRPGSDLDKQLAEVRDSNAKVAIGNPRNDRVPGDGTPRLGTGRDPVLGTPDQVTRVDDDKVEQQPKTRIDIVPKPPREPGADISAVIRKIRTTYTSGLQRCYKKSLGAQPTLAGKVALTLTVTEKGGVSDARAEGVDDGLEDCIEGLMSRWSFTPVTDADGDPADVDLGVTLQLSL